MFRSSLQTTNKLGSSNTTIIILIGSILALGLTGCSQAIDEVKITHPGHPQLTNRNLIFNADITGTTILTPVSTTRAMPSNNVGATALRTVSSSLSLIMTSGIAME